MRSRAYCTLSAIVPPHLPTPQSTVRWYYSLLDEARFCFRYIYLTIVQTHLSLVMWVLGVCLSFIVALSLSTCFFVFPAECRSSGSDPPRDLLLFFLAARDTLQTAAASLLSVPAYGEMVSCFHRCTLTRFICLMPHGTLNVQLRV